MKLHTYEEKWGTANWAWNLLCVSVPAGRTVFTTFLKSEFSQENIDFWMACEDYKKASPPELAARAREIYQQYVEADAPNEVTTRHWSTLEHSRNTSCRTARQRSLPSSPTHPQVNLDAATREETRLNVDRACPSCFDGAQKLIYALMEKDSYRRFLHSKLMHKLGQSFPQENVAKKNCNRLDGGRLLAGGA